MQHLSLPAWHRAHGEPLFSAQLRAQPEDFQVVEQLGWELSGDGEHDFIWLEKTGANTDWVAKQLARHAGVPPKDVGFAGLKDRHAVTRQWFSVPRWHSPDWQSLAIEGVRVLDVQRHLRKLRRGAHKGNGFRIVLRHQGDIDASRVEQRLQAIAEHGVPNYYGEQRFGRNAGNLRLADDWANGKRLPRNQRSIAISSIRSFCFNQALSERVGTGSWNVLMPGDLANLDGSGSVFEFTEIDDALRQRVNEQDVHPAIALVAEGDHVEPEHWQQALNKARVQPDTRSLRLRVSDLSWELGAEQITLSFALGRGAFATSVLRELCQW